MPTFSSTAPSNKPSSARQAPVRTEVARLQDNIEKVFKGKSEVVKLALVGLLARGHLLFEDVPGVGKTTLGQLLARSLDLSFSRIQFTSDMLPSDVLGVSIYEQGRGAFDFKPGPLFANVVLADELNRTTPKTQSALLEAMNSSQVSIDKVTHDLPQPFFVLATQNPVEFHGTFPLPKSQMDRFLMRLHLGYPGMEEEIEVLRGQRGVAGSLEGVGPVISAEEMLEMQRRVDDVRIDDELLRYLARIIAATRNHPQIKLGVSTRGALALRRAAQAKAFYENRDFVVPDDIKGMAPHVMAHRIQVARVAAASWASENGAGVESSLHREENEVLLRLLEEVEVPM